MMGMLIVSARARLTDSAADTDDGREWVWTAAVREHVIRPRCSQYFSLIRIHDADEALLLRPA